MLGLMLDDKENLLEELEEKSIHICEHCGELGSEVVIGNRISTLCLECEKIKRE